MTRKVSEGRLHHDDVVYYKYQNALPSLLRKIATAN